MIDEIEKYENVEALVDQGFGIAAIVILVFAGLIVGAIWAAFRSVAFGKRLIEEAKTMEMPISYQPLPTTYRCSYQDLLRLERYILEISPLVDGGKTRYSTLQFIEWANQSRTKMRMLHWIGNNRIFAGVLALLFLPVGFLPLIIGAVAFAFLSWSVAKFEIVASEFYRGELDRSSMATNTTAVQPLQAPLSDELSKLHHMFTTGALTEAEYQSAKTSVLKRGA